jgi:hypothetical protein
MTSSDDGPESYWCLVANVAEHVHTGPGGQSSQPGLKHFSPGTKLYCYPPLWGDGYEDIKVVGRHRGSRRLVEMIVPSRHLCNWRVKPIFSPALIRMLRQTDAPWKQWTSREAAQTMADSLNKMLSCGWCRQIHHVDPRPPVVYARNGNVAVMHGHPQQPGHVVLICGCHDAVIRNAMEHFQMRRRDAVRCNSERTRKTPNVLHRSGWRT